MEQTRAHFFSPWQVIFLICICLFILQGSRASAQPALPDDPPPDLPYHAYLPQVVSLRATYYVAKDGSDANLGTEASPWRSIQKGLNALSHGDTLYIKSGTYTVTERLYLYTSGRLDDPITISTAPGEPSQAVISGDTNGDGIGDVPKRGTYKGLVHLPGSYIHFQNLEVAYSGGFGINSGGSQNVLSGNNVHHSWKAGISVQGPDGVVENSRVWRNADSNYCGGRTGRGCNGSWGGGIVWGDPHNASPPGSAPRAVIRGNSIYNNSGESVMCMHTDGGLVEGNVVYDNWALNIDLDQCRYTTIQKNLIYYTNDKVWWLDAVRPGTGIMLSNEAIKDDAGKTYPVGSNRTIVNNILVGNGTNIYFWKSNLPGSAMINDLIAYNTLVATGGTGGDDLTIDAAAHKNTRILNNLIYEPGGSLSWVKSTGGLTFANNLWSKAPDQAILSPTDVIGDPLLVDPLHLRLPGAVLPEWYQLSGPDSPALLRGQALPDINFDFWDTLRSTPPDIGAHQFSQ